MLHNEYYFPSGFSRNLMKNGRQFKPENNEDNASINKDNPKIKVYKKRWLILFTFSITSFANALLFTCITSINDIVTKYYRVEPEVIDWAANSFTLAFVFIALPSSQCVSYFGLRTLVIVGSSLNAICTCFHFAGVSRNGIYYVMVGQFFAGFSVGAILQVPAKLSTVWFPEHEHSKATAIAVAFNVLGLAIGFLQPCYMVPDSSNFDDVYNGLYNMYLSHVVLLAICLIMAYFFFDEKPPLPPTYAAAMVSKVRQANVPGLVQSLKIMAFDRNFVLLTQVFGLNCSGYNFFITCFNEMSASIINKTDLGWVGFSGNMASIVGILLFSAIVDKNKCYQKFSLFLTFGTVVAWTFFSLVLLHWKVYYWVYVSFNLLCFVGVPFIVIGLEYAAELTYPVPEDLAAAIIYIVGNMYALIYVTALGYLIDTGKLEHVCYIVLGLYALSFILMCFVKQRLKRHNVEVNHDFNVSFPPAV